jgi:hypothetical protein
MHRTKETRSRRERYHINLARLPRTRRLVRYLAVQQQLRRERKQTGGMMKRTLEESQSDWDALLPAERRQIDRCALKAGYQWPRTRWTRREQKLRYS